MALVSWSPRGDDVEVARPDGLSARLGDLVDRIVKLVGDGPSVAAAAGLPGAYLTRDDLVGLTAHPAVLEPPPSAEGRLAQFANIFGLDDIDIELLLIAAAPEIDSRFERLFGWAQDDLGRRRAGAELALRLCGCEPADTAERQRLMPASPLVRSGLVELDEPHRPFPCRPLRIDDRVTSWLLGDDTVDHRLARGLVAVDVGAESGEEIARAIEANARLVYIVERAGSDARSLAVGALARLQVAGLVLDTDRLSAAFEPAALAVAALREAKLQASVLVLGPIDPLLTSPSALGVLAESEWPTILHGNRTWDPMWSAVVPHVVEASAVRPAESSSLWNRLLAGTDLPASAIEEATSPFRLTAEQVARAAAAARQTAAVDERPLTADDLRNGARRQNSGALEAQARRIRPTATWADVILPDPVLTQLREVVARSVHRDLVYGEWGLAGTGHRGTGLTALFAGPSGTGKTLSAEVIAQALGLDLYLIDLSTVVDKYIGETEKHLDRLFGEAERVNGILLFDEADALFGKRSEVKDAHDRYANLEVGYLLQRLEAFTGTAILTTNLRTNLDDAFLRRLDVVVSFPAPDAAARLRLWRHFLSGVPAADDLDLDFCAEHFELTGANIRSCVVTAGFLAAEEGPPVQIDDVMRGIEREYRKLGRLVHRSEFGPYADLLSELSDSDQ